MSKTGDAQELLESLTRKAPPRLVNEIIVHFRRTGTVQRRALRKLLGSQSENEALLKAVLEAVRRTSRE